MIIKKLTIFNFRSYYGKKEFVFSEQLNLILGANGDGKTTFFDAINWVLTPDYAAKTDEEKSVKDAELVSAKMFSSLREGEKGRVMVSLDMNVSGSSRTIEKAFNVIKGAGGTMRIDEKTHKAYKMVGGMRKEFTTVKDLLEKENAFPAIIKKYHIFKGEEKLNIFKDKTTLQSLIDMFSEVKDLEPYKEFASFARQTSGRAIENAKAKLGKQNAKAAELQNEVKDLVKLLDQVQLEIAAAKKSYDEATQQLDAIQKDYAIIQKAANLEKEASGIEHEIERLTEKLDENYSIKLLDEQWILMGFSPILKEFNSKLESLKFSKDNIEAEYRKKQEDDYNKAIIQEAKTELEKIPWSRTDIDKMKYMLRVHRCSYCGTEAPEGSEKYEFILQRIEDVVKLLTPKQDHPIQYIKPYFSNRNIEEMKEIGLSLLHTGKDIPGITDEIDSCFHGNDEIKALIASKNARLKKIRKEIEKLYASASSGEDLKDYVANFNIVNQWNEQKQAAASKMETLQNYMPSLESQIQQKRNELSKQSKGDSASSMMMANEFFRLLIRAFENTEAETYEEFLNRLSKEANIFLTQLNVDDFTGIIKIYLDHFNDLHLELQDKSGKIITNPNTSLLTTMHISILFAISELTRENRNAEYPLIFDAPTSSFDEGKDRTFYECLNTQVNKQCIVVTKSYLYKNEEGEYVTDREALSQLNCRKYRIKKLSGFDRLDLSTIDTLVEEIKED